MKTTFDKFKSDETGLTLIDMAIMLLIVGILTAPMMQAYHIWQKTAKTSNTETALSITAEAIDNFYFLYDHYPCPADPALGPNDPEYGAADVDGAGNCAQPTANGVVFGAIPFKALKMTPEETLDGYQHKLVYAVTNILTKDTTFDVNGGAIQVKRMGENADDECATGTVPPAAGNNTRIHMLFYSLGEDGVGAYNEGGTLVEACSATASADQRENCDRNNNVFVDNYCRVSTRAGSNYFDDMLYGAYTDDYTAPTKIWDNATDPNNIGTKNLFVGIGTPLPEHEVDVAGNVRATAPTSAAVPGNAYAYSYCNSDGTNCFEPVIIAGADSRMICSSGEGMSGIGSGAAKCLKTVPTSKIKPKTCASNEYVAGFDSGGNVICATAPP